MRIFLVLLVLALGSRVCAQERLMVYKSFGGLHFEYEKDTAAYQVTPKQVSQILFDYPEAYQEFKTARTHSTWSGILGFVGAGLIIIPTTTAILGGTPEWGMAAGGAALIAGSIPLSISYRRKTLHALEQFNARHSAYLRPVTQLYFCGTGMGLVIRF